MENNKFYILIIFALILFNLHHCRRLEEREAAQSTPVRDTLTVHDTVPFYNLKPRDSVVIRYDTIWGLSQAPSTPGPLPTSPDWGRLKDTFAFSVPSLLGRVRERPGEIVGAIPITSKTYEGDGWRAYVSGFRPSLDSLLLFPERQVITIRDPPASTASRSRSRRWALGVQAGYGLTPRGMQPYVGVGLSWHFNF